MKYLISQTNPNGSYSPINSADIDNIPENCALWPDDLDTADFYEYSGFVTLTIEDVDGVPTVTVYEPNTDAWNAWKATQPDPLDAFKAERINQSKVDLADYLEIHPLQWSDGEYYSITAEKQNQLTSKIMAATMAQNLSTEYNLTWNSTGEVCKSWDLQDLSQLAFAIDARVTALVSYQQEKEVELRNAKTLEELNNIIIDYNTVNYEKESVL